METYTKEVQDLKVVDLDEEIFYRETLGCKAKMEASVTCAIVHCGEKESRICQTPGESSERWTAQPPEFPWVGDGC